MSKVVVTGMGIVSPIGNRIETFLASLKNSQNGAGHVTRFETCELPTKIVCEVKDFNSDFRDVKISFAQEAARQAIKHANIEVMPNNSRLSIGIGLELFSMEDLVKVHRKLATDSDHKNMTFLNTPSDICCHLISKEHALSQSPLIHISACAAGSDAIGSAFLKIKRGQSDLILAGGTDSMINPMGLAGFCRIGAMTKKNDTPFLASNPFDKRRDGFLLGEGAGFLVLESLEHAQKRGAKILAEISGYGNSLDAYSISDPHPKGEGAIKCMERALKSAKLSPNDIDAISAHATGTPKNDPAESAAIRSVFKNNWQDIPVMATKSMIGHLISAAGAVETITSVLSLQNNFLHKTLNLEQIDSECELKHIIDSNQSFNGDHIIKNSFGFGGQNASLIISRYKG